MAKIPCGGFSVSTPLKFIGKVLGIGTDNMSLSDSGLEVSTGAEGNTIAFGCVEDDNSNLVDGIRGTDDIYLYAGNGKYIYMNSIALKSSDAGSTKFFKITVNDQGQLTATEI